MAWTSLVVTLRGTNLENHSATNYKTFALDCLGVPPYWTPEDVDDSEALDGYETNPIAWRRFFDFVARPFKTKEGDFDQGHYEQFMRVLRSRYLWIDSVTGSSRVNRDGEDLTGGTSYPAGVYDYWSNDGDLFLPCQVRIISISAPDPQFGTGDSKLAFTLAEVRRVVGNNLPAS